MRGVGSVVRKATPTKWRLLLRSCWEHDDVVLVPCCRSGTAVGQKPIMQIGIDITNTGIRLFSEIPPRLHQIYVRFLKEKTGDQKQASKIPKVKNRENLDSALTSTELVLLEKQLQDSILF